MQLCWRGFRRARQHQQAEDALLLLCAESHHQAVEGAASPGHLLPALPASDGAGRQVWWRVQGLLDAVPEAHKKFLRDLVWVHEQEGVETGDPDTSYSTLIAVHAELEASKPIEEQRQLLRRRDVTYPRIEPLSGRKNVLNNPTELANRGVLLVSGHHGVMLQRHSRLVVDESGGLDHLTIAAMVLPSRAVEWSETPTKYQSLLIVYYMMYPSHKTVAQLDLQDLVAVPYKDTGSSSNLHYSFEVAEVHVLMLGSFTAFDAKSGKYAWLQAGSDRSCKSGRN